MRHSCSQSEGAGRQALTSAPGAGPSPVTTPLCIRREESSLLHPWKKPPHPADPTLPPRVDLSLCIPCMQST